MHTHDSYSSHPPHFWPTDGHPTMKQSWLGRLRNMYRTYRRFVATEERRKIIEPNKDSEIKIERYTFALNKEVVLGESGPIEMSNSPDVNFRPQMVFVNVERPGMLMLTSLRVANVECIVGGVMDAYAFRNGLAVDYPTLTPANKVTVCGTYTGKKPSEYTIADLEWKLERAVADYHRVRNAFESMVSVAGVVSRKKNGGKKDIGKLYKDMLEAVRATVGSTHTTPPPQKYLFCVALSGPATIC